ncbi:hypothetical protein E2C01_063059 [Portunus trituberculatus]|uniref:Uncharacterized protein n=1 Tax=Portunus trituberculatus TaxID=210409 RepID=A0A5B7HGH6_PORTR|nr:hypothetical protein [Portunus trituberculatus]
MLSVECNALLYNLSTDKAAAVIRNRVSELVNGESKPVNQQAANHRARHNTEDVAYRSEVTNITTQPVLHHFASPLLQTQSPCYSS